MLAVDGTWNPYTQEAFKQVCKTLGIAPERTARTFRLIAGAAAAPRGDGELEQAAREFRNDLKREFANARQVRQAVVVGGTPMSEKERAAAYIAGLQRDLNTQLKWLGSTRRLKVDGTWNPRTQRAFTQVCRVLGVEPERNARTFRVIAGATVTRTQTEMRRAKEDGMAFKADLEKFFELEPSVLITQHKADQPGGGKGTGDGGGGGAGPRAARVFRVKSPELKGKDIRAFQRIINERYKRWGVDTQIEVDGEYGTFTRRAARQIAFGLGLAEKDYKHGFTPEVREAPRPRHAYEGRARPCRAPPRVAPLAQEATPRRRAGDGARVRTPAHRRQGDRGGQPRQADRPDGTRRPAAHSAAPGAATS